MISGVTESASSADREFGDDELIPIAALEHYSYCTRQYALIYVEQVFEENLFTIRGGFVHENAHTESSHESTCLHIERSLPLVSRRLGLVGRADVVEFHDETPYPVEYKYGRDAGFGHADLQLCAQALCLEEMTGKKVPAGAVYHSATRRRRVVETTSVLREAVANTVAAIRHLDPCAPLPAPLANNRCRHCSLSDVCLPQVVADRASVARLAQELFQPEELDG